MSETEFQKLPVYEQYISYYNGVNPTRLIMYPKMFNSLRFLFF